MSSPEFFDTNILLYAFHLRDPARRSVASQLVERAVEVGALCLSVQVLQEFWVNAQRKIALPTDEAFAHIRRLSSGLVHCPHPEDVLAAIELHGNRTISFWDALIVRSAQQMGCATLWSEDLSHGQRFGGVTVRNPFA